jgi:hypothetical protein
MKLLGSVRSWSRVGLVGIAPLLLPVVASAQDDRPSALPALLGAGFLAFFFICGLAVYVFWALALQTIANKTNTENAWLAWIPIGNIILGLNIARKPVWWIILFLIPLVSIVMAILMWMGIAEARNKPNWWGVLIIIPVVGWFLVPGYLAWSD